MKRLLICICLILPVTALADEYREDFSFTQEPYVNPNVLAALLPEADTGHLITSVNLADANDSNTYCCGYNVNNGWIENEPFEPDECRFGYRHIGMTDSGIDTLLAYRNCGGSGTFYDIMLVRLQRDIGYNVDSGSSNDPVELTRYPRYLLRLMATVGLGDRWKGPLTIKDNQLHIGPNTGWFAGKETGNRFQDAKEEIVIDLERMD